MGRGWNVSMSWVPAYMWALLQSPMAAWWLNSSLFPHLHPFSLTEVQDKIFTLSPPFLSHPVSSVSISSGYPISASVLPSCPPGRLPSGGLNHSRDFWDHILGDDSQIHLSSKFWKHIQLLTECLLLIRKFCRKTPKAKTKPKYHFPNQFIISSLP